MKICIAISGGIDSTIAAYILKKRGFDLIGVYLRLIDNKDLYHQESRAKEIAKKLNIPFHVVDYKKEFKRYIIEYFIDEYNNGRTPNPCIICNQKIKFGLLLSWIIENGCDYLATGHYVRCIYNQVKNSYCLLKGYDSQKDQSYFLYRLKQEQLKHLMFPLGELEKNDVKQIALKHDLAAAVDHDSQEICFITGDYRDLLRDNTTREQKGLIKDLTGKILGEHKGIFSYTIGQRRGLGISSIRPYYVVRLDYQNNIVFVGRKEECYRRVVFAEKLNFIDRSFLSGSFRAVSKIRYNHKGAQARVYPIENDKVKVVFEDPQNAPTPGQSIVFYEKDIVIGGGIIYSVEV